MDVRTEVPSVDVGLVAEGGVHDVGWVGLNWIWKVGKTGCGEGVRWDGYLLG